MLRNGDLARPRIRSPDQITCTGTLASSRPIKTLRHAAETADVLRRVLQTNALRRRLDRGFISLVLAMRMEHIEDSILYFMRALEGMLSANNSDQFKARAVAVLKSGSPELLGELYHVRNKLGHAEPIDEAFPGMTRPQAARRGRQLQAFLYHFATRAYRTILRSPDLMNRLTEVDVGAYWGDVVQSKVPPPFVVSVTDDVWDFDHDDGTHHLMRHEQVLAELQRDDLSEF